MNKMIRPKSLELDILQPTRASKHFFVCLKCKCLFQKSVGGSLQTRTLYSRQIQVTLPVTAFEHFSGMRMFLIRYAYWYASKITSHSISHRFSHRDLGVTQVLFVTPKSYPYFITLLIIILEETLSLCISLG